MAACANHLAPGLQIGPVRLAGRVLAAPMAGISDQPYRALARRYGAALATTEVVATRPDLVVSHQSRLRAGHVGERGPISVQLLGANPKEMAAAAQHSADHGAHIIDINMGCPAKRVCRQRVGSALLQNELLVSRILEAVVDAVTVPVTLKIRTGWNPASRNAPQIAAIAEQAGIQALTVHGRTRACGYHGPVEYDTIRTIKTRVSIPVIANGDIDSPARAKVVLAYTGADAVMIGRAAQGQPWLFARIERFLSDNHDPGDPPLAEKRDTLLGHLQALYTFYGEDTGVRIARKHVAWYTAALGDYPAFRASFNRAQRAGTQLALAEEFFLLLAEHAAGAA